MWTLLTYLRWTILWQDSLLSLSFDRSPIATMTRCQLPLGPRALTEGLSYTEAMYHLCQKILLSVNNDTSTQPDYNQIMADSDEVENLRHQVSPCFRTKDCVRSATLLCSPPTHFVRSIGADSTIAPPRW
jgi:hypothetical protein